MASEPSRLKNHRKANHWYISHMKRPNTSNGNQTSADIISGLQQQIDVTTRRLEKAMADQKDSTKPTKRQLLQIPFSCSIMLAWLYFGFLRPLGSDSVRMHAQQLDPTQIIAIPYECKRLVVYTVLTVLVALFQNGLRTCYESVTLSIYVFAIMLLSGASLSVNLIHTLCAAIYFTTLAFMLEPFPFPDSVRTSFASTKCAVPSTNWFRSNWLQTALVTIDSSTLVFHATLAVTIVMQILNLYDRGWQWQRWPVPMIVGSTFGWVIGNLLFAMMQLTRRRNA
ncbi:hypothetical protein MPSEU_000087100 [Mayamaea pseudoterrestris]|nr:hypothetical protein MPSEU_000087100 [Mayamaea pseudoterrestris]